MSRACTDACAIRRGSYCDCGGLQERAGGRRRCEVDCRAWLRGGGDVLVYDPNGRLIGQSPVLAEAMAIAAKHDAEEAP